MSRYAFVRLFLGLAALFVAVPLAHAGTCSNAQINQAYAAVHMAPNGSGSSGDCNPLNYGAGSWTSMSDLQTRVQHAHDCSDPWLGQIYWNLYNRRPTSTECTTSNYGGGSWSNYMDLTSKVQAYKSQSTLAANQYLVDPRGNLVDNHGTVIAVANTYLVSNAGGTLVGNAGGTFTVPTPGMVISNDGGSLTGQRSLMSNGKRVITARIVKP